MTVTINDRALGSIREQFRCVTIFEDFDHWDSNAQKMVTLTDHAHYSLVYATREGAEQDARDMRKIHDPQRKPANVRSPVIKRQVIERRLISDWEAS